jgi:hypothetical protein
MLLQLRPSALPLALLLLIVLSSPSSLFYQILAEMKEDGINMEFFGLDQLCLLCQAVVGRWKSQMEANGTEALKLVRKEAGEGEGRGRALPAGAAEQLPLVQAAGRGEKVRDENKWHKLGKAGGGKRGEDLRI